MQVITVYKITGGMGKAFHATREMRSKDVARGINSEGRSAILLIQCCRENSGCWLVESSLHRRVAVFVCLKQ